MHECTSHHRRACPLRPRKRFTRPLIPPPQRHAALSNPSHNPSKRHHLHHSKRTSITHTTLPHPHHLPTPLIPHKLKTPHFPPTPTPLPHLLHPRHHNPNRMPSTNRIPRLLQRLQPRHMAPALTSTDALEIHRPNRLVNCGIPRGRGGFREGGLRGAGGAVEGVGEPEAPVCEVGGDYEGGGGVCEVGGEEAAEGGFGGDGGVAYEDWGEGGEVGGVCAEGSIVQYFWKWVVVGKRGASL